MGVLSFGHWLVRPQGTENVMQRVLPDRSSDSAAVGGNGGATGPTTGALFAVVSELVVVMVVVRTQGLIWMVNAVPWARSLKGAGRPLMVALRK